MTPEKALSRLEVTALPNTRILVLHVTLPSAVKATEAVQNAGRAYLQARSALMNSSRAAQLTLLRQREDDLSNIVATMNATVPSNRNYRTDVTKEAIGRYANELQYVETTRTRLANNPLDVGQLVGRTSTVANHDGLLIKGTSGMILGLALWAMLATLFDGAFRRVGRRRTLLPWVRRRVTESDVPIIGRVHLAGTERRAGRGRPGPGRGQGRAARLRADQRRAVADPRPPTPGAWPTSWTASAGTPTPGRPAGWPWSRRARRGSRPCTPWSGAPEPPAWTRSASSWWTSDREPQRRDPDVPLDRVRRDARVRRLRRGALGLRRPDGGAGGGRVPHGDDGRAGDRRGPTVARSPRTPWS